MQVLAACVYTAGHYVYFHYYISNLMKKRAAQKNDSNGIPLVDLGFGRRDSVAELEDEFPFESLMDFLPSRIDQVCLEHCCRSLNMNF
jgi:hypothetical protein